MRRHAKATLHGLAEPGVARSIAFGVGLFALCLAALVGAAQADANDAPGPPGSNPEDFRWEKVSPDSKGGADIIGAGRTRGTNKTSVAGDAFLFTAYPVFAGAHGGSWPNNYLATRGDDGWSTEGLTPPQRANITSATSWFGGKSALIEASSPDLDRFGVSTKYDLLPGASPDVESLYVRDMSAPAGSRYTLLTPEGPSLLDAVLNYGVRPEIIDATPELDYVLFASSWPLTPDASLGVGSTTQQYLYLWGPEGLELVSKLPGGEPARFDYIGSAANSQQLSIAPDGSRVFFSGGLQSDSNFPLYVYDRVSGTTTEISPSSRFMVASADGRYLLHGNKAAEALPPKLFRYDAVTDTNELISDEPTERTALAASDDLSRVYFTSDKDLVPGQESTGGESAIYVWEEGQISHVANLNSEDPFIDGDDTIVKYPGPLGRRPGGFLGAQDYVDVTPDGSRFVFHTPAQITPYDNEGTRQVYVYDIEASTPSVPSLTCVSCPPAGPQGDARLDSEAVPPATGGHDKVHPRRGVISTDGSRVFFQSADPLVHEDGNGRIDVYYWQDGQVNLVSSGRASYDAQLADASADGNRVFFVTRAKLTGHDTDELIDVYAAVAGGGFPEPPPTPVPCQGDACQGASTPPPAASQPASQSLKGRGNLATADRRARCRAKLNRAKRLRRRAGALRQRVRARRTGARDTRRFARQAKRTQRRARVATRKARRCVRAAR